MAWNPSLGPAMPADNYLALLQQQALFAPHLMQQAQCGFHNLPPAPVLASTAPSTSPKPGMGLGRGGYAPRGGRGGRGRSRLFDYYDSDEDGVIIPAALSDNAQYHAFNGAVAAAAAIIALAAADSDACVDEPPDLLDDSTKSVDAAPSGCTTAIRAFVKTNIKPVDATVATLKSSAETGGMSAVVRVVGRDGDNSAFDASRAVVHQVSLLARDDVEQEAHAQRLKHLGQLVAYVAEREAAFGEWVLRHVEEYVRRGFIEGSDDEESDDESNDADDEPPCDPTLVPGLMANFLVCVSKAAGPAVVAQWQSYKNTLLTCVCRMVLGTEVRDCHELAAQYEAGEKDAALEAKVDEMVASYEEGMGPKGFVCLRVPNLDIDGFLALPELAGAQRACAYIDIKAVKARQEELQALGSKTLPLAREERKATPGKSVRFSL